MNMTSNDIQLNIEEFTFRKYFPHYISMRWWNKKNMTKTTVSGYIHRRLTRFIFQSVSGKKNTRLINQIAGATWASQFKYMYSPIAPPRIYFGKLNSKNRCAFYGSPKHSCYQPPP